MFDLTNWKHSRKVECPVLSNWNVAWKAGNSARTKIGTHLCRWQRICWVRRNSRPAKSYQGESLIAPIATGVPER